MKSLEARGGRGRLEVEEMPVGPPHFVTELMVIKIFKSTSYYGEKCKKQEFN